MRRASLCDHTLALVFFLGIALGLVPAAVQAQSFCVGDVNQDTERNIIDVVEILNHIVGSSVLDSEGQVAADTNSDRVVDILDVIRLIRHIVGLQALPECISNLGPSLVSVDGPMLIIRRRSLDETLASPAPYIIRGVVWSPASPETNTSGSDPNNAVVRRPEFGSWYETDIPLMAGTNINTARLVIDLGVDSTLGPIGLKILDEFYRHDMMVIMNVDDAINDLDRVAQAVRFYRNHPAILMWMLGSEWNINLYFGVASSPENAARRTEQAAALIKTLDPNHPVATSYGDINIEAAGLRLTDTQRYVNEIAPSVDIWALNIYRGCSFRDLFNQWTSITDKPMFLGEFGTDAFKSDTPTNPPAGTVDEAAQVLCFSLLWNEIELNLSARDSSKVALGGTVFEWNDEWWKVSPAGSQQTDGFASGGHPDGFANEEYFGVVDIGRAPRLIQDSMRRCFDPSFEPEPNVIKFTTLPGLLETNIESFFVSGVTQAGDEVLVNGELVSTDEGFFVKTVDLAPGDNTVELVIRREDVSQTHSRVVRFDPNLSTRERRLLYVDCVAPALTGTAVIDIDNHLFLGLLKDKHVRGISPTGDEVYMHDRTVISTTSHRLLPPAAMLAFTQNLSNNNFLVSPDGKQLFAGDEVLDRQLNQVVGRLPISIETGSSFGAAIPGGPAISDDSRFIYVGNGTTRRIDVVQSEVNDTGISGSGFLSDIALSPNGRHLLESRYSFADGRVLIFDSETFSRLGTITQLGDFSGEIAVSRKTNSAVVGSAGNPSHGGGRITVFDLTSLQRNGFSLLHLADNLAISSQDEVFVSSGNQAGIDRFSLLTTGTILKTMSYILGINRFVQTTGHPANDEIRKIVFKDNRAAESASRN